MTPTRGQLASFSYLQADNLPHYRAILDVFLAEKERFAIALRPADIVAALSAHGSSLSAEQISEALAQLVLWGNLDATHDTADVATVEDFYRARYLYQFSAAGEAVEHALTQFAAHLGHRGELKATALRDIVAHLEQLQRAVLDGALDPALSHRVLAGLTDRFSALTSRAQTFLRTVQRPAELHRMDAEAFIAFKEKLIDYLERFIGELVVATNQIAEQIISLEQLGIDAALNLAAQHEAADDVLAGPGAKEVALRQWRNRWSGLHHWFIGDEQRTSQAELLRQRARAAIPALLAALASLNDRRATKIDRSTEWLMLADWFAETKSEDEAHVLWRAAFGLHSSRHLHIDDATLTAREAQGDGPKVSWLDAVPMAISPHLRQTGRPAPRGPVRAIIDRSAAKAALAELARREAEQIARAQRTLATGKPVALSRLAKLDRLEFGLLLDLLGEALSRRGLGGQTVDANSTDGSLRITLVPLPDAPPATIWTQDGTFTGPDHLVTIRATGGRVT